MVLSFKIVQLIIDAIDVLNIKEHLKENVSIKII